MKKRVTAVKQIYVGPTSGLRVNLSMSVNYRIPYLLPPDCNLKFH